MGNPAPSGVRRGMSGIIAQLGAPARPVRVRGKSVGRSKGATVEKAKRYKVVYKTKVKPEKATPIV